MYVSVKNQELLKSALAGESNRALNYRSFATPNVL